MHQEDRIMNPSRATRQIIEQAERIGPATKKLCQLLFEGMGRVGHRKMRGIVALSRRHKAAHIETASKLALERGIRSSRSVRKIVERIESQAPLRQQLLLTQSHTLIREVGEYESFWQHHAVQATLFPVEETTHKEIR
jgi:hypothetical protein